jgi:hypothetical protein
VEDRVRGFEFFVVLLIHGKPGSMGFTKPGVEVYICG